MLVLLTSTLVLSPPNISSSFSNSLSQSLMKRFLSFCPPAVVRNEIDVMEGQSEMSNSSMLFGHLQCSILSHFCIFNELRVVMTLLPQLSPSSFSPNLTNF
ncbi:hypothetical protein HanXRQr2_Chr13g0612931 [Helianthus annuus]|uniref:Uncharacterized protein n=1 Tax=Helianthus annuus TaxID=4232 RepID=A0A9K3ELJ5_HELAN|nr:hypothetical protein HanXRQr2_Chr13g0612931 [Helianthus annuus]KAJ0851267.1 hypothetical protein HanPSC8_Chr13g0590221 [Helianthus annuus]